MTHLTCTITPLPEIELTIRIFGRADSVYWGQPSSPQDTELVRGSGHHVGHCQRGIFYRFGVNTHPQGAVFRFARHDVAGDRRAAVREGRLPGDGSRCSSHVSYFEATG